MGVTELTLQLTPSVKFLTELDGRGVFVNGMHSTGVYLVIYELQVLICKVAQGTGFYVKFSLFSFAFVLLLV